MRSPNRHTLIFGIAALLLILGTSSLALSQGGAAGQPASLAVEEAPANGRYVPGLVSDAQGSYTAFPTPTPGPTPIGVQDAANRFFVSASAGDDANDGTRDAPFRSTQLAFEAAVGIEDAEIYVSTWPQTVPISPPSGISVYGGYTDGTWQRSPDAYTRVSSTGRPSLAIVAVSNVRIEGFQFEGGLYTDLVILERMSVAAIVVDSAGIVLTDNIFIAANGANGKNGANGEGGAAGSSGKNGTGGPVCPPSNPGGAGGAGARKGGAGGTGGAFGGYDGSAGQSVSGGAKGGAGGDGGGFAGASGKFGGKGQDGSSALTPGESGGPIGVFQDNLYLDESGKHGTSTRTAGAGGGGGGGGAGAVLFLCGGGGGGGGGGGYPAVSDGKGGQAGGPSFGLYVVDSEVSIRDNQITTGDGGDGGKGGNGALGGAGGAGGYGADNGGRGGSGGDGGGSAPGGGGGGGPSIGIIANGGSSLSQTGNAFSLGAGGQGGAGGYPPGTISPSSQAADGLRVEFYQAP